MTEAEVMDRIGEENWDKFLEFMVGQTVGSNEDGSFDFFECDVENFEWKMSAGEEKFFD